MLGAMVDEAARGYSTHMLSPRIIGERIGISAGGCELLKRSAVLDAREIALPKRGL